MTLFNEYNWSPQFLDIMDILKGSITILNKKEGRGFTSELAARLAIFEHISFLTSNFVTLTLTGILRPE